MTPLSRNMLPSTERSASRLWGRRRSCPGESGGMVPPAGRGAPSAKRLALRASLLLLLFHHEDFDLGLDVMTEVHFHAVEGAFPDRSFQANHLRVDVQVLTLQCAGDLGGADRT